MKHRKRFILISLIALVALAGAYKARHWYWRNFPVNWENPGDYAGAATRGASPHNPSKPPSRPWLGDAHSAPPQTTYHTYPAATLGGRETYYLLYLPPGYHDAANQAKRYPVIYWFHGFHAEPQHGAPFVEGYDAGIRTGDAPPAIIVLPNGLHDSWFVDSVDGSQPVESVIVKDLMPMIDRTLRTIPDRSARATEGFSMGGWGALHLTLKYPDLFCSVTSVGAPFHRAEHFPQLPNVFSSNHDAYYAEDPITTARRNAARLRDGVRIRLLVGDKDGNLGFNRAFSKRLDEWGIPHGMRIVPGIDHNDGAIYEKLGREVFKYYQDVFGRLAAP